MKVLLISDTHGWEEEMQPVFDRHAHEVDAVFHCGDSELDKYSSVVDKMLIVKGNCDYNEDFPEEMVKEIDGTVFYISHGHLLSIKSSHRSIIKKGKKYNARILCHGHSHIPSVNRIEDKVIINPGSLRLPRNYSVGTYAILESRDNDLVVTFFDLNGNVREDLNEIISNFY